MEEFVDGAFRIGGLAMLGGFLAACVVFPLYGGQIHLHWLATAVWLVLLLSIVLGAYSLVRKRRSRVMGAAAAAAVVGLFASMALFKPLALAGLIVCGVVVGTGILSFLISLLLTGPTPAGRIHRGGCS